MLKICTNGSNLAGEHSPIITVWCSGDLRACPKKKLIEILFSMALENTVLQDNRSTKISINNLLLIL